MAKITTVAIVGASGSLGSVVLEKLVAATDLRVRVLRRVGSTSTYAEGIDIVDVDFSSLDSLTTALKGQDAVVSTIGSLSIANQRLLVDAAIAAGVHRFIPSNFGSNHANPKTRRLLVFAQKVQLEDYLVDKSQTTGLTYTFVYNSAFLDWGLQYDFILKISDYKPNIYDGGDLLFSTTTLASVADAVVGVLRHPDETRNRAVYIHDAIISQNQLLALAKKVAPNKPWEPVQVKLDDMVAAADARLAKGIHDMETFVPYILQSIMDPAYGGKFEETDNELLGVGGKTEEGIVEILKQYLK